MSTEKPRQKKNNQKQPNRGDVAEGLLACALMARFLYPYSSNISINSIENIIKEIDHQPNISNGIVVNKQRYFANPFGNVAYLSIGLSEINYQGLIDFNFCKTHMKKEFDSILEFVSSDMVINDISKCTGRNTTGLISISSMGTEDQKNTKVDVEVAYNNVPFSWGNISLKTGSTKQLGQIGKKFVANENENTRGIYNLFHQLFGVEIDQSIEPKYKQAIQSGDKQKIIEAIENVYSNLNKKIQQSASNQFISNHLSNGIKNEATLNQDNVTLLILENGTYKTLKFDDLYGKLTDSNLVVEFLPSKETNGYPYLNVRLKNNKKLISIRPKIRSKGEFRHYVQKEDGLIELLSQ